MARCIKCKKEEADKGKLRCSACQQAHSSEVSRESAARAKPVVLPPSQPIPVSPLTQIRTQIQDAGTWLRERCRVQSGKLVIPVDGMSPVPPIVHFIWIGPRDAGGPIPDKYVGNIKRMAALNPSYKVWVWTDTVERVPDIPEVRRVLLPDALGDLLDIPKDGPHDDMPDNLQKALEVDWLHTENFAAVSDILRVLILFHHGGVYCDTDNEARQPFPSPMPAFGMRVGLSGQLGAVTNALMASTKGFPFFWYLARRIADNYALRFAAVPDHKAFREIFSSSSKSARNELVNDMSGPLCLNLLMDVTTIGGMEVSAGFLVPWKGFAIPKEYVFVGSDQTWLQ